MTGSISKWIYIIIGVVVIALVFPILMDGIVTITSHANILDFTGLEAMANITPLLGWIAFIGGVGFLGFNAVKGYISKRKSKSKR